MRQAWLYDASVDLEPAGTHLSFCELAEDPAGRHFGGCVAAQISMGLVATRRDDDALRGTTAWARGSDRRFRRDCGAP